MTSQVLIIQRVLPYYRIAFFHLLFQALKHRGIELRVAYGQERPGTVPRTERGKWEWGSFRTNSYLSIGNRDLVWQSSLQEARCADLVVVEHSSRLLLNYILAAKRALSPGFKLALWGHGRNFQLPTIVSLNERLKDRLSQSCDWWFAYTELSKRTVEASGFPNERISMVQNTIDTSELRDALDAVSDSDIERAKAKWHIAGNAIGLFCGGMYVGKRLNFLLDACRRVRRLVPEFEVVFVGDGPELPMVQEACSQTPWMHYVGPAFGRDRAIFFKMSRLVLMPGLVGLAIVDSFVSGRPLFTTNISSHSPEIAYLSHGENGWMSANEVDDYSLAVANFLRDPSLQRKLEAGCAISGREYLLENMVTRFADGLIRCLDAKPFSRYRLL